MPKSGNPKDVPGDEIDPDEVTDPSFEMGRLPEEMSAAEPKPAAPPQTSTMAPVPMSRRTQTQVKVPRPTGTGESSAEDSSPPPPVAPVPEPQSDEWGSYNEDGDGWNVTSANVELGRSSTQDMGAPTGKASAAGPRPLDVMSTSTPGMRGPMATASSGIKSRVLEAEMTHPPALLQGLRGGDVGRKFTLDRDEMTFGRDPSQSFVLHDESCSREHARIVRDETGYVVIDNQSNNGTFVNGKRVERSRLQTGDEVAFGSSHFRFLTAGEEYRPPVVALEVASAGRVSRFNVSVLLRGAVWISVVALLGLAVWKLTSLEWGGRTRAEIFTQYQAGVAAFNDHQWDAAEAAFRAVLRLDANHVRGKRYLNSIARQRAAEAALTGAQILCRGDDLAACVNLVTPLLDTVFRRDAIELLRGVDSVVEQQVARAQSALDQGAVPVATGILQSVEAVRPGRPDVAALLTRASQTPVKPVPKPVRVVQRAPRWPAAGPVAEAVRLFIEGDVNGARTAVEKAQSDDAARLRTLLNEFREAYEAALGQHRGKRAFNAIRLFNQAKAIEAKISAGQSKLVSSIDVKLADMYYVLGMEAYLGSKLPEAADDFRTAVSFAPDHALSAHKLHELEQKAQDLFDEAQRLKSTDTAKARSDLETVVEMLTPRDELYRKAQARLAALK